MLTPADLAKAFARNATVITWQTDGLSNEDSLIQTPYRLNCLNWVVGHVADGRDGVLEMLGAEPVAAPGELDRYQRESDPILEDGPGVLPLARLLEVLALGQERIDEALGAASEDDLASEEQVGDRTTTLGDRVHFAYFHDTYHTGQTELLRQFAGTDDKII